MTTAADCYTTAVTANKVCGIKIEIRFVANKGNARDAGIAAEDIDKHRQRCSAAGAPPLPPPAFIQPSSPFIPCLFLLFPVMMSSRPPPPQGMSSLF